MLRKSVRSSDDSMANLLLSDSRINCASSTNASTGWNKSRNSNSSRPITSHEAAVLTQGNVFSNQSQGMHPVHLNANSKVRSSKVRHGSAWQKLHIRYESTWKWSRISFLISFWRTNSSSKTYFDLKFIPLLFYLKKTFSPYRTSMLPSVDTDLPSLRMAPGPRKSTKSPSTGISVMHDAHTYLRNLYWTHVQVTHVLNWALDAHRKLHLG